MKRVKNVVLAGVAALALVIGLFGVGRAVGVANAQSPTPTAPTAPTGQPPINTLDQSFWTALAGKLGISVDQLTTAVKAAAKDVVASELQAGHITQDQATQINSRVDQWQPGQGLPFGHGGGPGRGGPGGPGGPIGGPAVFDAAAKALGMTTADLQTALQSGQTLSAIAQSKGVSADTVKAAIVAAKKAEVDAAVTAGRLTSDQATQIKQQIDQEAASQSLDDMLRGPGHFDGGPGGPGGHGFPGGPQQTPVAPTATPGA
ncbi:MAG: hypothetical protein U0822_22320 [Anaerolineae bacterium]